ncbi:hypothetical protein T05_10310 [Trichinella murrelli]|uniref:Uncharacterized protein n=1 Tax=Trichinella murrelli TaxID=144512 RepID=A0A0V0T678_9BILA|nr:hypothetical protein T05_10310 [Trichinella murrelli]
MSSIYKRKSENADDTKQIADDTKQIEDDTKQIEDDTKQKKRRQSSWDPNSVGLGLGYFERAKYFNAFPYGDGERLLLNVIYPLYGGGPPENFLVLF